MRRDTVILERRYIPAGKLILKEGDDGTSAFLIQSGSVRVFTMQGAEKIDLAILEAGEIFGEMSLIFKGKRSANVEAVDDCNLIVINNDTLQEKMRKSDPTIRALVEMLTKRVKAATASGMNKGATIHELETSITQIYQSVMDTMEGRQQRRFKSEILPRINSLLDALKNFRESTD